MPAAPSFLNDIECINSIFLFWNMVRKSNYSFLNFYLVYIPYFLLVKILNNRSYFFYYPPQAHFLTTNSTNYTNKLVLFFYICAIRVICCFSFLNFTSSSFVLSVVNFFSFTFRIVFGLILNALVILQFQQVFLQPVLFPRGLLLLLLAWFEF